jgi:hypothetical protein
MGKLRDAGRRRHGSVSRGPASSRIRRKQASGLLAALMAGTVCLTIPSRAVTQEPLDSLRDRLERAEEQLALLRQQLATQSQSQVQAKSRVQVELWGLVLANGWRNSGPVNALDGPTLALPASSQSRPTLGGVFRQSLIGLDVLGVRGLGAEVSASVSADFFGGVHLGAGNRRLFPEPRLRIARVEARWPSARGMFGHEVPLVAPEEPVSLASIGSPDFALAGNLWFWLPQLRIGFDIPLPLRIGVDGAVVAPWSGEDPANTGNVDIAEASGRPSLQARVHARWSHGERTGEIGVGTHVGWLRVPDVSGGVASTALDRSWAVVYTARIPIGWFELRGEAYQGELLRGLGGGGIGQNFSVPPPGAPRTLSDGSVANVWGGAFLDRAAWAQLNVSASPAWLIGGGCGVDDPRDSAGSPLRTRNQACEGHLHLRPGGGVVLAVEVRNLRTNFQGFAAPARSTHSNVGIGFEF